MEHCENSQKGLESSPSEDAKIVEIFELCLQPKTKKDLNDILMNFREITNNTPKSDFFGIFDYICMYVLDYVYKHDTASFCSVSRTLYLYQMLDQLILEGTNRSLIYNCNNDCLLNTLRQFKDLHTYSKKEEMLVDVGLGSILTANLGLSLYLVKFGLIEFPTEVNERCEKMFEILVGMFNSCSKPINANVQADGMETSLRLDDLLNKLKEKQINIRRSIFTFCVLNTVAEYKMHEKLEERLVNLKFYTEHKKQLCLQKLECINLYVQAATEPIITFKDIEDFIEVFLNPFLSADEGKSLVAISRKILGEEHNCYNPRPLKDVARFKVRSTFRSPMCVPAQVNELDLPVPLKEFLNFHTKGIWKLLVINHLNLTLERKINPGTPETERNGDEIPMRNAPELADENADESACGSGHESASGNDQYSPGTDVQESPCEIVHELSGPNVHEVAGENSQQLQCGNEHDFAASNDHKMVGSNVQELEN